MYCRKCGRKIDVHASFCNYCGVSSKTADADVSLSDTVSFLDHSEKKSVPKKWMVAIIASGIFVIAMILTMFIIPHNKMSLTKQEAQHIIDSSLNEVFLGANSDNFIMQSLKEKVKINVDSINRLENEFSADCTATSIDVTTPILNYIYSLEGDSINTYVNVKDELIQVISDAPEVQKSFRISFLQSNDGFIPVFSEELIVFCSGNVHDLLPELYKILQGDGVE